MIRSIEEARQWYIAVQTLARDMKRLAGIWDEPALEQFLSRDNHLRERTSTEIIAKADTILEDLDDLVVLLLFSVFEATIRDLALADVDRETAALRHPAVLSAVKNLKDSIESGSFSKVTNAYKSMDVDLTAQVDQVRDFRNWVAHGRRDEPKNKVDPKTAIDRLQRYLARFAEIDGTDGMTLPPIELGPE